MGLTLDTWQLLLSNEASKAQSNPKASISLSCFFTRKPHNFYDPNIVFLIMMWRVKNLPKNLLGDRIRSRFEGYIQSSHSNGVCCLASPPPSLLAVQWQKDSCILHYLEIIWPMSGRLLPLISTSVNRTITRDQVYNDTVYYDNTDFRMNKEFVFTNKFFLCRLSERCPASVDWRTRPLGSDRQWILSFDHRPVHPCWAFMAPKRARPATQRTHGARADHSSFALWARPARIGADSSASQYRGEPAHSNPIHSRTSASGRSEQAAWHLQVRDPQIWN